MSVVVRGSVWEEVAATPVFENKPFLWNGWLVQIDLEMAQRKMAVDTRHKLPMVTFFLCTTLFQGAVLDLGCGTGANTIPFYKKGWKVTSIDRQSEALLKLTEVIRGLPPSPRSSLSAIIGDIVTEPFPSEMDVVICSDVLPYILPTHLETVMKKIHNALRMKGIFIGTLFTMPSDPVAVRRMNQKGAYFYPRSLAVEIVIQSGFKIAYLFDDVMGGSAAIEFMAEKI